MGWGAAHALADEMPGVFGSPEEAYESLYGQPRQKRSNDNRVACPICGKKCAHHGGVIRHMDAKHDKPKFTDKIADFKARYGVIYD